MNKDKKARKSASTSALSYTAAAVFVAAVVFGIAYFALPELFSVSYSGGAAASTTTPAGPPPPPPLDKAAYDTKLLELAHVATSSPLYAYFLSTTTATTTKELNKPWPVRAAYPADGRALLPFNRIVSYYGNFYSTAMGVLGQYPPDEMIPRLQAAVVEWEAADPSTPVIPAIHYIAMVAQAAAGADGKYRAAMPDSEIDKALELADQIDGIVFLDLQVGLSSLQAEVPQFEKYLQMPQVELGIDPEFAMQASGVRPGRAIGTLDAADINYVIEYLADLVKTYNLPPKILVVHRFTEDMITNYKQIKPVPEVQVVIDMDGWGDQAKKIGTYTYTVAAEPVQFTGFKLFYKNDLLPPSTGMLTPEQVLDLTPAPSYIQYQ